MKIFLDANILVSVLNKEYPVFTSAAKVMSLQNNVFHLFTSPVCLAIAFYFAEKKHGTQVAKRKISLLLQHIDVAGCGKKEAMIAASDPRVLDFEDGLEYYAAKNAGCSVLITEDTDGFYFADIPVCTAEDFLKNFVVAKPKSGSKKLSN